MGNKTQLGRKRKWTHEEALECVRVYGYQRCNSLCRHVLSVEERREAHRQERLEAHQLWEKEFFGRVISKTYTHSMECDTKVLTT